MIIFFFLFFFGSIHNNFAQTANELFPVDAYLRPRVDFWKKVYTEITSKEAYLHDEENLSVVYKKIVYPSSGHRERKRFSEREKKNLQKILQAIINKQRMNLTPEENELAPLVANFSDADVLRMSKQIRRQQGMADRYYEGLVRAHPYLDKIRQIFSEAGVPEELIFLPHVESSFNYRAYSKVGAAGMWQFMRSAARIYGLKMNYLVDERRDPIASTKSAARFLRDNYAKLGAWPLAVTAYNHGPKSIARAVAELGTKDLSIILQRYRNRRFGFASKNFYTTFMATVEISKNPEKYFPNYPKEMMPELVELKLSRKATVDEIVKASEVSKDKLQDYNLAIRPAIFRSRTVFPKDFVFHLPASVKDKVASYFNSAPAQPVIVAKKESKPKSTDEEIYEEAEPKGNTVAVKEYRRGKMVEEDFSATDSNMVEAETDKEYKPSIKEKFLAKVDVWKESIIHKFITEDVGSSRDNIQAEKIESADKKSASSSLAEEFNPNIYDFSIEKMHGKVVRINVEIDETLSHYAEWAKVSPQEIRQLNRMRSYYHLRQGQKLLIPLLENNFAQFSEERESYHKSIEEDLFTTYKVTGMSEYKIHRGDSLALICKKLDLPFWLLRKYQPNIDEIRLVQGTTINIPILEAIRDIDEPAALSTAN